LVAASALFWGLRLFVTPAALPVQARLPAQRLVTGGDLHRLLGAVASAAVDDAAETDANGRFQLLGVVAPRGAGNSPQGVALIAVGDQPAKAWRTGAELDSGTVLLSVGTRSVHLGPRGGPATTELTLPDPTHVAAANAVPAMPQGLPGNRGVNNLGQLRPLPTMPGAPVLPQPGGAQPGQPQAGGANGTATDDPDN
jgi:general secretion pathway protein C